MKITLINPAWYFDHPRNILCSQNLGLGYLAAFLKQHGHSVTIIDALAEGIRRCMPTRRAGLTVYRAGLDNAAIVGLVPRDTDFIGITTPFSHLAPVIRHLSAALKAAFPRVPISLGGVYASLAKEEAAHPGVDHVVIGEGEQGLLDIVERRETGKIVSSKPVQDLDSLPFPARELLPMETYLAYHSPRKEPLRSISIITSRGCPFDCTFCSIHCVSGYAWRKRSSSNVLAEIDEVVRAYAPRHIEFEDDNLTLDRERATEIFSGIERINAGGYALSWSTPNGVRIDTLDRPLLELIKRSNCRSISLGLESGDPEILRLMNKTIRLEKALEVAAISKELGLKVNAFFIIGFPGETDASFRTTLAFARRLKQSGVDTLYYTVARAYPGTPFHAYCSQRGYISRETPGNERIYLGNILTPDTVIQTPDCNLRTLKKRLAAFARAREPWYIRFYQKHHLYIKRFVPLEFIRRMKFLFGRKP